MDNVVKQNKADKTLGQHPVSFSALAYFDTYLNDEFQARWLIQGSGLTSSRCSQYLALGSSQWFHWVSHTAFVSAICTEGKVTEDSHFCLFLTIYHLDESLLLQNEI